MVVMARFLCQRLSPDWSQAYARLGHILTHTVRASSAVACMNRVLRMHQARHRQVSQGMLESHTSVLALSHLDARQAAWGVSVPTARAQTPD